MKKSIIICFVLLGIISCKKETTANNSTTEKNQNSATTEEKKEENSSIFGNLFEEKPTAFVKQDNGKNKYQLNLEKGKTYPFNLRETEEQTLSGPKGSESIKNESYDEINFTVQDTKNDRYQLLVTFVSKSTKISAQGKTITVDTKSAKPNDANLAQTYKLFKALVGTSFNLEVDKNGKVTDTKNMENIYKKVEKELKPGLKKEEYDALLAGIKATLNPEVFKKQFEAILVKFPSQGVQQGDTWKDKPEKSISDINYKLTTLDENQAIISVSSTMKPDSKSQSQNGLTMTAGISGNQTGTLTLDAQSGWMKNAKIVTKVTETQSLTDGKRTEKASKTVTSSTIVN